MENLKPQILNKVGTKKSRPPVYWLLPFLSFVIGYFVISYFFRKTDYVVPNVIGKPLHEAVRILSQQQLGIRLLQEREESTLAEGTIIDQLPSPSQKIRPNQNIFITMAVRTKRQQMPDLWGKSHKEVVKILNQRGLEITEVFVPASYSAGMCVAQLPAASQDLEVNKVTVYFSADVHNLCVMPNLRGASVAEVQEALRQYDVRAEIIHGEIPPDGHTCIDCKIIDQEPVPGAIVNCAQGLAVQLKVARQ
jgi:beta-lactam-binding protein with PASTA domain